MIRHREKTAALTTIFRIFIAILALTLAVSSLASCKGGDGPEGSSQSTPKNEEGGGDVSVDAEPKKRVAITFDDGPQYYNDNETRAIVDELAKYGFTATFFVVGNRISSYDDALTYAVANGNEIGIHGYTHDIFYDKCSDEEYNNEIQKTLNAIKRILPDYEVKTMRAVGGRITDERIAASPYAVINWSVDSDDWNNKYVSGDTDEDTARKIETTVNNVMNNVSDGDIILMHDIWSNTYDAVVIILQRLYEEGYEVVSVSELLGDSMQAGKEYFRAE